MAQLTVRDIPDDLESRRRTNALAAHLPTLDAHRESIRRLRGLLSDSTEIIREQRDRV